MSYAGMKTLITSLVLVLLASPVIAEEQRTTKSPEHRVSLLELYTSEGCSSCPPADRFLSGLHDAGVRNNQLIPLAFHVTYWDYIGWKDPYASPSHDQRQRDIAKVGQAKTIYTPQFVLNGSDYRDYGAFSTNIRKVILQLSEVDLELAASSSDGVSRVELRADVSDGNSEDIALYLVVYENDLVSDVSDGENEGETLHHDYVVRRIHGPFQQDGTREKLSFSQTIQLEQNWKKNDLGLVAFAQDRRSGKVLQAVDLKLF